MHRDLVQLFNLAAVFTVQQPLATSSEMRAQENLPSLYFHFGIVYFNLAITHPWGDSHINRAGVLNRNFEKNHEKVPRVCFVDMVLILKRHIISCYLFLSCIGQRFCYACLIKGRTLFLYGRHVEM